MSFDIHCHTCNLGTKKKKILSPFTGEAMEVFADDGLNANERVAVRKLLAISTAKGPDEHGCYVVKFRDRGEAEVVFDKLDRPEPCVGCMAAIRGITPNLVSFIYELCLVGNMLMTPIMEEPVTLVTSADRQEKILARWPNAVVVVSASELQILLEKGVKTWREYRDSVVDS